MISLRELQALRAVGDDFLFALQHIAKALWERVDLSVLRRVGKSSHNAQVLSTHVEGTRTPVHVQQCQQVLLLA